MATIAARPDRLFGSTLASAAFAVAAACSGNSGAPPVGAPSALEYPFRPSAVVVNEVQSSVPGLSPTQVAQGMGGVLYHAQRSMQPGDFTKVKNSFPGSDAMIAEGTKLGMPSEMYGLTSLSGSLKNIGISRDQVNQMIPAMTEVVREKAGPQIAAKFAAVFQPA
jgi:hypothetical protein